MSLTLSIGRCEKIIVTSCLYVSRRMYKSHSLLKSEIYYTVSNGLYQYV